VNGVGEKIFFRKNCDALSLSHHTTKLESWGGEINVHLAKAALGKSYFVSPLFTQSVV